MAGWYVSDSETEDKEIAAQLSNSDCVVSIALDRVFGEKVNTTKMIELLKRISFSSLLELECTNGYLEGRKHKRRKRKRKKRDSFPDGEVSETTSERISTYTASTCECKDTRRPSLSTFDYEHEEFPALRGAGLPKRKPIMSRKKLLSPATTPLLASIEAQLRSEEQQVEHHEEEREIPPLTSTNLVTKPAEAKLNQVDDRMIQNGLQISTDSNGYTEGVFTFSSDEEDSSVDPELNIYSKIRHIESFLDQNY